MRDPAAAGPANLLGAFQVEAGDVDDGLTGFTGFVADIIVMFGEVGVGALVFIETVFPPIPSEPVLALAGWQAQMGRMSLPMAIVAATLGGLVGALFLYWLGAKFGEERAKSMMARLPLVDREDLELASNFFHRHGFKIVLLGRFVPIARSLVSLPAGAQHMPLLPFLALTAIGSGLWNTVLIGSGYLLGTQFHLLEEYLQYLDLAVLIGIALFVTWYVIRIHRKRRVKDALLRAAALLDEPAEPVEPSRG